MSKLTPIPIDYSWAFSDKTIKDTSYITHGYYTYPAKFIPQLASKLINDYSEKNDIVIDPFMGSGTTIVESLVNSRVGIGTDINEIAYLLSKVKTTALNTSELTAAFDALYDELFLFASNGDAHTEIPIQNMQRIDYWFLPSQKKTLLNIFSKICLIENADVKDFFLIAFAQILKSCSIWLQKSVKPTRDHNKKKYEPILLFFQQAKRMIKKNEEFNKILPNEVKNNIERYRTVEYGDSRKLPCKSETAKLIVSSPPYVTSYEYADLHQLPLLWFGHLNDLSNYRKKYIGSAYRNRDDIDLKSATADDIISKLNKHKKSEEVKNYFADMLETFMEIRRVLKKGGKACIVIGNTEFNGVQILNAEVFQEQFENIGFRTDKVIHREIPSKMLPSTRNILTGQFTKKHDGDLKLAYPTEYIIVMEKL
ncbi:MAG: site-specific DNA-methyltransferase [Helicobacteraceae bacterium]|jgi:DNA modification methylase|nr:site-specific DNA-methyltransferase [Helicobacteraceae bacterium]